MTLSYIKSTFFGLLAVVALSFAPNIAQAQPDNDSSGNPETLDHEEGCVGDASYSNVGGTGDETAGSCAVGGLNSNVWFEFEATETFVRFDCRVGGSEGTMRYATVTLFDDSFVEIACATYTAGHSDVILTYDGLNPGDNYYFSVDCLSGYEGTFGLCLNTETNSFMDGATNVSPLNTCFSTTTFTTIGAYPDQAKPGCWYYGPLNNVWFSFTATTNEMTVTLHTQGGFGTMRYPMLSLQDDINTVLGCSRFSNGGTRSLQVTDNTLLIGDTYFVNVDNAGGSNKQGTFTLCFDDGPGGDKLALDPMEAINVEKGFEAILFPNPASDVSEVYVKGAAEMGDVSVQVTSLTGSVLRNIQLPDGVEFRVGIETADLAPGVYMVVIEADGGRQVKRLIKS